MPKEKNRWSEFSQQGEVLVPQQIKEFQQKKKEAVAVEDAKSEPAKPESIYITPPPPKPDMATTNSAIDTLLNSTIPQKVKEAAKADKKPRSRKIVKKVK